MADTEDGRPPLRCLILDDDEDDARLLESYLRDVAHSGVMVRWEPGYEAALAAVRDASFTVCFVDYLIGEPNGIEFIKSASRAGTLVPLILLT